LSPAAFQACINNKELLQAIQQRAEAARREYEITSTPTFIVDGKKIVGATRFEEFQKVIEQQLEARRETKPESAPGAASPDLAQNDSAEVSWMARQWERLRGWWDS
jgi:predicted DsbA family dithiol-disulfide isomerase